MDLLMDTLEKNINPFLEKLKASENPKYHDTCEEREARIEAQKREL
jgi:hypothetical protein